MENLDLLILEHLLDMRGKIDQTAEDARVLKAGVATVEAKLGTVLQHLGHFASSIALQKASFDRLTERMERMEKRLDLAAAP